MRIFLLINKANTIVDIVKSEADEALFSKDYVNICSGTMTDMVSTLNIDSVEPIIEPWTYIQEDTSGLFAIGQTFSNELFKVNNSTIESIGAMKTGAVIRKRKQHIKLNPIEFKGMKFVANGITIKSLTNILDLIDSNPDALGMFKVEATSHYLDKADKALIETLRNDLVTLKDYYINVEYNMISEIELLAISGGDKLAVFNYEITFE